MYCVRCFVALRFILYINSNYKNISSKIHENMPEPVFLHITLHTLLPLSIIKSNLTLTFYPFPRVLCLCYSCHHRGPYLHICCGSSPWSDQYPCLHHHLLSNWGTISILCQRTGHCHKGSNRWEKRYKKPTCVALASGSGGLREHTDQLLKQGSGHIQHLSGDSHLLCVLHHIGAHVLRHSL